MSPTQPVSPFASRLPKMQIEHLGPYKIGRKLGRGGMGTVYEGVSTETGEPAAIKVLSTSLAADEGFRDRFKVEIDQGL